MSIGLDGFSFTKASRLNTPGEYRQAFACRPLRSKQGIVLWGSPQPSPGAARLGIAVSKRAVSKAVSRNRLRRLIRESFRRHQHALAGFNVVVQIRRDDESITLASLDQQWQRFLAKQQEKH